MPSERVCSRCGEIAKEHDFCPSCGLHLAVQPELPTRAEWEAEHSFQADADASALPDATAGASGAQRGVGGESHGDMPGIDSGDHRAAAAAEEISNGPVRPEAMETAPADTQVKQPLSGLSSSTLRLVAITTAIVLVTIVIVAITNDPDSGSGSGVVLRPSSSCDAFSRADEDARLDYARKTWSGIDEADYRALVGFYQSWCDTAHGARMSQSLDGLDDAAEQACVYADDFGTCLRGL